MIIEENQLRPPSPKEMEERQVWLEKVVFVTDGPTPRAFAWPVNEITTLELIEFHKDNAIPYEARLLPGYDQDLILDWTHLSFCEICKQWFLPDTDHTTTDALHLAKVREMTNLLTGEEISDDTEAA